MTVEVINDTLVRRDGEYSEFFVIETSEQLATAEMGAYTYTAVRRADANGTILDPSPIIAATGMSREEAIQKIANLGNGEF